MGLEGTSMRHSLAVMSDRAGNVLSTFRLQEPISLHTTPDGLLRLRLEKLLMGVLKRGGYGVDDLKKATVCIGLTGVTFGYDREVALPAVFAKVGLPLQRRRLICTGDIEIAFASYAQSMIGSAVICHCGSTAYVVLEHGGQPKHFRIGGWGPAIGDEGSGYAMGRAVLRAIGVEHEEYQEKSVLWCETEKWLRGSETTIGAWKTGMLEWKIAIQHISSRLKMRDKTVDPRTVIFHWAHCLQKKGPAGNLADREGMELWRKIASVVSLKYLSQLEFELPGFRGRGEFFRGSPCLRPATRSVGV